MKKLLSILLLTSAVNMAACQNQSAQTSANGQKTIKTSISVSDYEQRLTVTPNAQLIDVRTPGEYEGGHLKNAVNININGDDFEGQLAKLDKTKPVMVYCLSGGRSSSAANKMAAMGFTEVYNMEGGIMQWRNAGKPLETGAAAPKKAGMTMDAFNKLLTQNQYVLVDYNATWCEPCKKMLPVLEAMATKKKDKLSLAKVDADENKDLLKEKGIAGIPYLELYQNGKLIWSHNGFIEEADLLKETKL